MEVKLAEEALNGTEVGRGGGGGARDTIDLSRGGGSRNSNRRC